MRPAHAAMENRVYRWDDPVWDIWYPPNGFRCRCMVVSLTEDQVRQRHLTVDSLMPHEMDRRTGEAVFYYPDNGFSANPAKNVFRPDLSGIRPDLRAVYQDVKKEHDLMRKKQREKDIRAGKMAAESK